MRKTIPSFAMSLLAGTMLFACSYNDIYEPWFDEDASLYEEDAKKPTVKVADSTANKAADNDAGVVKSARAEDEGEQSSSFGFFDWFFGADEAENGSVSGEVASDTSVYNPEKDFPVNSAREYDSSVKRKQVEVIRPLANPNAVAEKEKTALIAGNTVAVIDNEDNAEVNAERYAETAGALIATASDSSDIPEASDTAVGGVENEEFVEIPIAILTNKPTPMPAAKAEAPLIKPSKPAVVLAPNYPKAEVENSYEVVEDEPMPAADALIKLSAPKAEKTSYPAKEAPKVAPAYAAAGVPMTEAIAFEETPKLPSELVYAMDKQDGASVSFFSSFIPYMQGSRKLDSKDSCSIRRTAELCNEYNCVVRVIANASPALNPNAKLMAQKRANTIKQEFVKNRISDDRIVVQTVYNQDAGDFAEIFIEY